MQAIAQHIDMSKVRTIIYHLPNGLTFSVPLEEVEQVVELGYGRICDTSDIDGVIHFYPRGHA